MLKYALPIVFRKGLELLSGSEVEKVCFTFRALGSPVRLRILYLVSESKKPLHIKGIVRKLKIDYAAVYRHVKTLEKAGVVRIFEVGRSRVVSITKPDLIFRVIDQIKTLT